METISCSPPTSGKKRKGSAFSLSPVQKSAERLLQQMSEKPAEMEVRKLGVQALSRTSAEAVLKDKQSGYTICAWPRGKHTNAEYQKYLCQRDILNVFFFLCRTSPDICIVDATMFLFKCLAHFLRKAIAEDLKEDRANVTDFLGPMPMPFQHAWQIEYVQYVKWVDGLSGDLKINHGATLRRAEYMLRDMLVSMGYELAAHQHPFDTWVREHALRFDAHDRGDRNILAHFFTDLLRVEHRSDFLVEYPELPHAKNSVLTDEYELAKKVLALDSLIAQADSFGRDKDFQRASLTMIHGYLERKVERGREIKYGESVSFIPGKYPPNQLPLEI